jgi:hypothetical protein
VKATAIERSYDRRITAGAGIHGASSVEAVIRRIKRALELPGAAGGESGKNEWQQA